MHRKVKKTGIMKLAKDYKMTKLFVKNNIIYKLDKGKMEEMLMNGTT